MVLFPVSCPVRTVLSAGSSGPRLLVIVLVSDRAAIVRCSLCYLMILSLVPMACKCTTP